MTICPACGEQNPDRARFCLACGTAVPAVAGSHEARKVVTVLFADLVGFTSRSELLDVEEVRGTLRPYHQLLRRELERYGGTVEKFIGDAVMALFGAPVAREDDAERAVRAAIGIQEAVARLREDDPDLDLNVRIGVSTGEVLVSVGARPDLGEGMAFGDTVNVAARLQAAAAVDGVLVSDACRRLTERAIEYVSAPPVVAKGKREPVIVWAARGVREAAMAPAALPPLVGRDRELAELVRAFERARAGVPQPVAVVGAAGMGKSRLMSELQARVEADGRGGFHVGRAQALGASPLQAFADVARSVINADGTDAGSLDDALVHLLDQPADRSWVARLLEPLLRVDARQSSAAEREEMVSAWRLLLQAAGRLRPAVVVFEDMHCADEALLELVCDLAQGLRASSVLVVATGRGDGWQERLQGAAWTTLELEPLGQDSARELAIALLAESSEVASAVASRSGGNPLFVVELARAVAERHADDGQGTDGLPVPETVQAVIAARIDSLVDPLPTVLREVAVVGDPIRVGAVAHAVDAGLDRVEGDLRRLVERGLIAPLDTPRVSADPAYGFVHDVIREVAYAQVVRGRRADLHARAAEWAVEFGDELAEFAAHHYWTAIELLRATRRPVDSLIDSAGDALRRAGEQAMAVQAFTAAGQRFEQALELCLDDHQGQRGHLLLALGRARYHAAETFPETLVDARGHLLASGESTGAAEAEMLIGSWLGNHGRMDEGLVHSERAFELLAGEPPSRLKADISVSLGERAVLAGDLERGLPLCREAARLAAAVGANSTRAQALLATAVGRLMQGDMEAEADIDRALDAIRAGRSPHEAVIAMNCADVLRWLGALSRSYLVQEDGARRVDELGTPFLRRLVEAERIRRSWYDGDWPAALARATDTLTEIEAGNPFHLESCLRVTRASILAATDPTAAFSDLDLAVKSARASGDPEALFPALAARARLRAELDQMDAAVADLSELEDALQNGPLFLWGPAFGDLATATVTCGRSRSVARLLRRAPATPWRAAAQAILNGALAEAAQIYGGIGSEPDRLATERLSAQAG